MNKHRRINRIKAEQRNKLEKLKSSKLLNKFILLGIPILGIAALIILSLTGIVKFQYFPFLQRILRIVVPIICVGGLFLTFQARFRADKSWNYFVRILIWLIFFSLFMYLMLLIIPDSILFQIQEYFESLMHN